MWSTGIKATGLQRGFRIKDRKWKGKMRKYRQLAKHILKMEMEMKEKDQNDMGRKMQRRKKKKTNIKKVACQKKSTLSVKRMRCDHIRNQFWPCRRYSQKECNFPKGNAFIIIRINKSIEELFNFLAISPDSCSLQRMSEWQSLSKAESHLYYSCQSKLQSYKMHPTGIFVRYVHYSSPQEKNYLGHSGIKEVSFFNWIQISQTVSVTNILK